MTLITKPKNEPSYWEEGQRKPYFHWYRKGFWKRILRKRWIKARFRDANKG